MNGRELVNSFIEKNYQLKKGDEIKFNDVLISCGKYLDENVDIRPIKLGDYIRETFQSLGGEIQQRKDAEYIVMKKDMANLKEIKMINELLDDYFKRYDLKPMSVKEFKLLFTKYIKNKGNYFDVYESNIFDDILRTYIDYHSEYHITKDNLIEYCYCSSELEEAIKGTKKDKTEAFNFLKALNDELEGFASALFIYSTSVDYSDKDNINLLMNVLGSMAFRLSDNAEKINEIVIPCIK